ncbi:hypothetical protein B4096_2250 [Heyndrickxia coagulans]|nr:hypothetical protein B4096_2250 [Heyndrickxia coagulans]
MNHITNNCLSIISPFSLFVFVYILNVYEAITREKVNQQGYENPEKARLE